MNMDTLRIKLMIKTLLVNYGKSLSDLIYVFASRNYEIRLAGETARDILMNKIPNKLELVSSASLHQMKRLFTKKNIPITVDKRDATITLRYGGQHHSYRIATICPVGVRTQPESPGTVNAYWVLNAYHRTFTVNSIFVDFSGTIYDSFNGCADVMNRRIRLNSDPDTLIKADYLRIFKYFKLLGLTADAERGQDRKTLKAITDNINGLGSIRGESIWSEFKTILMQPQRYECVKTFFECGGAPYLGLPDKLNLFEFRDVTMNSNFSKHPLLGVSYLCTFMRQLEDVMKLHQRLRLSSYERDLAIFLVKYKETTRNIDDLVFYRRLCLLPSGVNKQISREYVLELLKYHNKKRLFNNLLVMESPSRHIDPVSLQLKKRQLKRIRVTDEATNGINDYWYRNDMVDYLMGEPLLSGMELSGKNYSSSKKKQRLH